MAVLLLADFHRCDTLTMLTARDAKAEPVYGTAWIQGLKFTEKTASEHYLDPISGEPFMRFTPEGTALATE